MQAAMVLRATMCEPFAEGRRLVTEWINTDPESKRLMVIRPERMQRPNPQTRTVILPTVTELVADHQAFSDARAKAVVPGLLLKVRRKLISRAKLPAELS
jgi:hypothetical protein